MLDRMDTGMENSGKQTIGSQQDEQRTNHIPLHRSNATITAEYVFLRQVLGLDLSGDREALCH